MTHARRWPPTDEDRREHAVVEVCGYLAQGQLDLVQLLALSIAVREAEKRAVLP